MELKLDGSALEMEAAVSENVPVSALDVPKLSRLLQLNPNKLYSTEMEEALVVTRAQARREVEEEKGRRA